ncbi:MAG: pseudouridine-5'-phosphate glycosidase [Synergistaceae bacterium]|nr:pseudouridine-5'-phosphate glycosidase [Synergistota bacterium]NLM72232.1 pseudouridine-5'-phosphate glycosidase [Synergistaceae bacterium]
MIDDRVIKDRVKASPEVAAALNEGRAVVALESTIISHGMPYPENVESARTCERIIRAEGAMPATIAIIGGVIRVGLSDGELEHMGRSSGVRKVSRRDLPMVLASGGDGATTVASTMIGASLAGVRVFATGGIGGVHRGAQQTFDISADLMELASTPLAVVCAGAKSILDIGLTLEVLETHGVPVIGYGTDLFPAFYVRDGGFPLDERIDDVRDIARVMRLKWSLGLSGGIVVANPIPREHELDPALISRSIEEAVNAAESEGVRGKEITPFILARLNEVTEGRSLAANKQLVYNNARIAARLALAYAGLDP